MTIKHTLKRLGTALASVTLAAVMLLGSASNAWAGDKVHLKDGRILEGEIVRELNGSVWIKYSLGGVQQEGFFTAAQIESIERDAGKPPATSEPVKAASETEGAAKAKRPGEVRGVVITLEGTVGMQFAAKPLEDAIPWLEAQQVDVVVLKINSGGGYLLEIENMHEVIVEKFKPKFRTVAWIESAISAAAMSSHVLEEIYFMPEGNYGACTGWFGALQAVEGYDLQKVLYMMEKASAEGKKDFKIMRSMQIEEPLSYNRDGNGDVTWYNTDEGKYLVNPKGRILTFDAVQAENCGFSKGTTDKLRGEGGLEQLLGYPEVNWIGRHESGEIFPISKVEEDMRAWRASTTDAEERLGEYMNKYVTAKENAASSTDMTLRGQFVGLARQHLGVLRRICREHPNIAKFTNLNEDWFRQEEKILRDLLRP